KKARLTGSSSANRTRGVAAPCIVCVSSHSIRSSTIADHATSCKPDRSARDRGDRTAADGIDGLRAGTCGDPHAGGGARCARCEIVGRAGQRRARHRRPSVPAVARRACVGAGAGLEGRRPCLERHPQRSGAGEWRMDGALALTRTPGGALSAANISVIVDTDAGSLDVHFVQRNSTVRVLMPLDQPSHMQLSLKGLPLAWLQGVLASAWKEGRLTGGSLDGELALDVPEQGAKISGRINLAKAGVDSKSGSLAAQQLGARGTFSLDATTPTAHFDFDGSLNGGQMLLGPLYAQLPAHAAQLQLSANVDANG